MRRETKYVVIGCGSGLFCGSGKNKTRVLDALGRLGHEAHYVTTCNPHLHRQQDSVSFTTHVVDVPRSDFLAQPALLAPTALAERMTEIAVASIERNGVTPILWGTYLFPFALAAMLAKKEVSLACGVPPPLITFPAGSDIWQIGSKHYHSVRQLLYDPSVDCRITYSETFRDEIYGRFGSDRPILVIPPLLNMRDFSPPTRRERLRLRGELDIPEAAVVAVHHSNMRPVKNASLTIDLMAEAASHVSVRRQLYLLLVGPQPRTTDRKQHGNRLHRNRQVQVSRNLIVRWTGLADNVGDYLRASDFAVNCSLHDSFNISLMEAMACGLPCVTTDVVGLAHATCCFKGGFVIPTVIKGGHLFDVDDPTLHSKGLFLDATEFVRSVVRLASDGEFRLAMGAEAARYVRRHFGHERIIHKYLRVFASL